MVSPGPGLGPPLRVLGVCSGRWVPSYLGVGAMCPPLPGPHSGQVGFWS